MFRLRSSPGRSGVHPQAIVVFLCVVVVGVCVCRLVLHSHAEHVQRKAEKKWNSVCTSVLIKTNENGCDDTYATLTSHITLTQPVNATVSTVFVQWMYSLNWWSTYEMRISDVLMGNQFILCAINQSQIRASDKFHTFFVFISRKLLCLS